ncbi:HPF/RaiA family ribosome-associated protein [Candidatus Ichthyocystis sparus]|uniref:HPF/RaiA family ribosome-associated protein n=1 Tax=Candidatus Ichthyocystis sparus TaxID=1561004 RepID=UPI000B8A1936|nr:HPF/RaiA family ribosome-associated protein [Candidatus Ichthyocystis sparus]
MEIIVFGKNIRPTKALKEFTEKKFIGALRSISRTVDKVRVVLSKEKESRLAKAQCNVGHRSMSVQEGGSDIYDVVSTAAIQLNKVVSKEKGKKRAELRRSINSVNKKHPVD